MNTRHINIYKFYLAFTVIANLCLCCALLGFAQKQKKSISDFERINQEWNTNNLLINNYFDQFFYFDSKFVECFVDTYLPNRTLNECLYIIVPPNPCSTCLAHEYGLWEDYKDMVHLQTVILAPDSFERNIGAVIQKSNNIDCYYYRVDSIEDDVFDNLDQLIYAVSNEKRITTVVLTSRLNSQISNKFFNHYTL